MDDLRVEVCRELEVEFGPGILSAAYIPPVVPDGQFVQGEMVSRLVEQTVQLCQTAYVGDWINHGTPRGVREVHRLLGRSPSRYRPSSESLIRRVLKSGEMPRVNPVVDVGNSFSIQYGLPLGIYAAEEIIGPVELRIGGKGEQLLSLRGPIAIEGFPVLADEAGVFGSTYSDSERTAFGGRYSGECLAIVYGFSEKRIAERCASQLVDFFVRANVNAKCMNVIEGGSC